MVVGCHTYTSPSVCCSVSLSHQCVENCGSQWDFCPRKDLVGIVLSTLFQVSCVYSAVKEHVLCWHDFPAVTVTCSVITLDTRGLKRTCVSWVSGRILTLLQQGYLSSEIRQTILINKSQLGINSQLWNLKTLLFPVSLFYQFSYIYFLKPKYRDILTDWIGPFSVF